MEERDRKIFEQFLQWAPLFAGESIRSYEHQGLNVSPDIIATTMRGERIGVELTDWIDERYFGTAQNWRKLLEGSVNCTNWSIRLSIKNYDFDKRKRRNLQSEFAAAIQSELAKQRNSGKKPTTFCISEIELSNNYPLLATHVREIFAIYEFGQSSLNAVPTLAGRKISSTLAARNSMLETIVRKLQKTAYATRKTELGLHQLHLLVHYDFSLYKGTSFGDLDPKPMANDLMDLFKSQKAFDTCWLYSTNCFVNVDGCCRIVDPVEVLNGDRWLPGERPYFCDQILSC
ncbi:MAG: hypothetical protein JST89_14060 [Cyanobacteria bacterium SZAS-4]|nr:hypothetical protein [Cyanobacteria bacterium SZAS-4]